MRKHPIKKLYQISLGKKFQFRIHLGLMLLFVVLEVVLLKLGTWQLNRAEEKESLLNAQIQSTAKKSISLNSDTLSHVKDYQSVLFRGTLLKNFNVYIANEPHKGQDGYHIFSALELDGSKHIIWVNRGWVRALPDRRVLPDVELPPMSWSGEGEVYFFKGKPILYENALTKISDNQWLIQGRDFDLLKSVIQERQSLILPYIIRLAPKEKFGFVRDWQVVAMPPEKHIAYAIQWFGLAITLCIIFVFLSIRKAESSSGLQ
ncbi:SURF1 family protein [Pleionea sp. CnH1-48]|uniref:SURF1 family protein n=1 Tax=Pleionea sp. CnH1-48 TaxID=2954494 RepID=UPI002096EE53|nr:SURF1 family protein [Pleionea sp. CnH1-48]MCO7224636.1 SURF1 family protein [Pleionea sp. CnH1-48]